MGVLFVTLAAVFLVLPTISHADTCTDGTLYGDDGVAKGTCATPSTAAPYDFKNEGIFGCNQVAGASASAGTMAAVGGVYVPVNDAAVTLNTGILVYKECVLRPLQDRLRESATSALLKKQYITMETGREGNKRYVVNISAELLPVKDKAALAYLTGTALGTVSPARREQTRRALAQNYRAETRGSDAQDCDYETGDANLSNFEKLAYPSCNPFYEFWLEKKPAMDAYIGEIAENQRTMWDWGRGFYAVTDNPENPLAEKTLTPASVVQESFQQVLGSPVRQLESANDVGQIIGTLFASVTTQALTDSRGLAGLAQSSAGRPPYIDQVARESSQGVIGAAVNAALTILSSAKQVEATYLSTMNAIASNLTQTINQLRSTERQCWTLVVPKVQEYASSNGVTLDAAKIRTSTSSLAFSQQIIDAQITPLAQEALTNVKNSQRAMGLIDQLIAGVTNTASLTTQRLALEQLDDLVDKRAIHYSQYEVQNVIKQRDDISAAMASLVTDTAKAWGDSPDASVGWCNINNAAIPQLWAERWKK